MVLGNDTFVCKIPDKGLTGDNMFSYGNNDKSGHLQFEVKWQILVIRQPKCCVALLGSTLKLLGCVKSMFSYGNNDESGRLQFEIERQILVISH